MTMQSVKLGVQIFNNIIIIIECFNRITLLEFTGDKQVSRLYYNMNEYRTELKLQDYRLQSIKRIIKSHDIRVPNVCHQCIHSGLVV